MTISDIEKIITQNAMISFTSCYRLDETPAVYASTPITTGKNYLEWLKLEAKQGRSNASDDLLSREVFVTAKNIEAAAILVRKVRERYSSPVIDPTRLHNIPNWSQNDYHQFWIKVIRQLVSIIVFAEGWEYSNGSTLEYMCGLEKSLSLLTHDFQPLPPIVALSKLKSAVADYGKQNVNCDIMQEAVQFLERHLQESRVTHE